MLTGVFKDRSARDRGAQDRAAKNRAARDRVASEEQALAELLTARELRGFALTRQCEIGPFVVEYLFAEQSLIVELVELAGPLADDSAAARRRAARLKFFNDMGYVVVAIDRHLLTRHPRRALARLRAALRS